MSGKRLRRRDFLKGLAAAAGGTVLAACAPQVVKETVVVERAVEKKVIETVVVEKAVEKQVVQTVVVEKEVQKVVTAMPAAELPEFVFWYGIGADYGERLQNEFNEAGLGFKAVWEAGEYDTNTKTMASLAAGNPPPISHLGRWQHGDLATRGAIYALDDRIDNAATWSWDDIWDRMAGESMMWGKKWVVPFTTDTRALWYNKEVMRDAGLDPEKPPTTWYEVQDMAVQITEKDDSGRIDRIGFTPTFGNPPVFVMFWTVLWCLDGSPETDDMTTVTLMDKGPAAMEFLKGLMDAQGGYEAAGAFTRALTLGEGIDPFSAGKVGLMMHGNRFKQYAKYSPGLNFGLIPGPVFPEYNIIANYDGGGGWYFFKEGQGTDMAWKFLEYWMDHDNMLRFLDYYDSIPSRKSVAEPWAQLIEAQRRIFVSTANTVRWPRLLSGYLEYCGHVATAFDNIMIGGMDIESELQAAQDRMQPLLDEHNSVEIPT